MKNMLILSIALVFSTQVFGVSHGECTKFGKDVLEKAVFQDPKASDNEDPVRFIKEEKVAAEYLNKFDVKKLNFAEKNAEENDVKKYRIANNCDHKLVENKYPFCESFSFNSRDFFVGLIYGMKNYGWSKETILLGKQKLWEYLNGAVEYSSSSLNLLIANDVAKMLAESKLVPELNLKELTALSIDHETESRKLSESYRDTKGNIGFCELYKKNPLGEANIANKYAVKFKKVLSQWKKP